MTVDEETLLQQMMDRAPFESLAEARSALRAARAALRSGLTDDDAASAGCVSTTLLGSMKTGDSFFNLYNHDLARVAVAIPRVRVADPAWNAEQTLALLREAHAHRAVLALGESSAPRA